MHPPDVRRAWGLESERLPGGHALRRRGARLRDGTGALLGGGGTTAATWSAAARRWRGDRSGRDPGHLVHRHLRRRRTRDAGAVRSTAPSGRPRALSTRPKPHVSGAAVAVAGAAFFYQTGVLLAYVAVFLLVIVAFLVWY